MIQNSKIHHFYRIFAQLAFVLLFAFGATFAAPHAYPQEQPPPIEEDDPYAGERTRRHAALRVFSEFSFGAIFGAVALGTPIITNLVVSPPESLAKMPGFWVALATYPAAVGGGTLLGGWLAGGQSSAWQPFVGAYSAAVVADIIAYFTIEYVPEFAAALIIALPIIGAITAYEISDHLEMKSRKSQKRVFVPIVYQFSF
ncbi:MAG: hypothetical protein WC966_02815 [Bradymonadales bacterium]